MLCKEALFYKGSMSKPRTGSRTRCKRQADWAQACTCKEEEKAYQLPAPPSTEQPQCPLQCKEIRPG